MKKVYYLIFFLCLTFKTLAIDAVKIKNIDVLLFYNTKGKWSENISSKTHLLWNSIIGEGAADFLATDTLFVVNLTSKSLGQNVSVALKVLSGKGKKQEKIIELSKDIRFADSKEYSIPLLVNNTGCTPIVLEVLLNTGGKEIKEAKSLPFACGE